MDLTKIDKNFITKSVSDKTDIEWHNVKDGEFQIYGLYKPYETDGYVRMPQEVADTVNEGVAELHTHTAGGRIRFTTDSPYIAILAETPTTYRHVGMGLTAADGFDLYVINNGNANFFGAFPMPFDFKDGFSGVRDVYAGGNMVCYEIEMPLYAHISSLHIGLKQGSKIEAGEPYRNELPIVYYGSSITQGACASRPGTCYEAMISHRFNLHYTNLGFSGSCKGEKEMAEYIASLPMSCFVCDYDHNSPSLEHYIDTHYPLYETIRKAHPDIPYIMISRPTNAVSNPSVVNKFEAMMDSYNKAVANGDKNVYYIDGREFYKGLNFIDCSWDLTHPNDIGFHKMSEIIGNMIEKVLLK